MYSSSELDTWNWILKHRNTLISNFKFSQNTQNPTENFKEKKVIIKSRKVEILKLKSTTN